MVTRYDVKKLRESGYTPEETAKRLKIPKTSVAAYEAHLTRNGEWGKNTTLFSSNGNDLSHYSGNRIVIDANLARDRLNKRENSQLVKILEKLDNPLEEDEEDLIRYQVRDLILKNPQISNEEIANNLGLESPESVGAYKAHLTRNDEW